MKKYILALVWLLNITVVVRAQQFPVQLTPQLLPPYSLQVSEYYSPSAGNEKLRIMLLNRDLQRPQVDVRLRMIIESQSVRLRTREDVVFPTLHLTSGTPYYITPSELASYFNSNNLEFSGISKEQYEQTGKLPEGLYSFCIEAVEVTTGLSVSTKGCAYGWMTLSEPPLLNLPRKAESVTPISPQNLIFNWTPRHTAAPGATMDYEFSIIEINDPNINPEAAFLSLPVLFTDHVSTTTYLYDASKPQLIPGKKYAWRVRAVMKQGTEDLAAFRNNGISETYWFTYQNTCVVPVGISAQSQGQVTNISWQSSPDHLEYKLEYREKNVANAQWFTLTNTAPRAALNDLKPSTLYEYRIGAACEYGLFNYTNLLTFTTNSVSASNVEACGDTSNLVNPGQTQLNTLVPGDTINAGDFSVIVTQVSGSGNFTGEGYVKVPWLMNMNLAVKFTSITVDLQKKLMTGTIITSYDPTEGGIADVDSYIDAFTAGYGVGGVVTGLDTAEHYVRFIISMPGGISTSFGSGYDSTTGVGPVTITITPSGGGAAETFTEDGLPTTIKDAGGNIYQVNKNGTVSSIGKSGGDQLLKTTNKSHIDSDKAIVKFVDYPGKQIYAIDEWKEEYKKNGTINKEYERLNNDYYVSAKAIAPGKTDYIKALVTIKDTTIKADSIKFVNGKGTIYNSIKLSEGVYEISIVGGPGKDAQEIYALYTKAGSKTLNFGKLLVSSYPVQKRKLVLIPVASASCDKAVIAEKLNSIYNKVCVAWEVSQDANFEYKGWDKDGNNKLAVNGSSLWSDLTEEMKLLNGAYIGSRKVEPNVSYMFVLDQAAESTENVMILGDMPRAKQFGYLFTGNGDAELAAKTVAHEVGHGVFRLKHIFESNNITKGLLTPTNLMDYPSGSNLIKLQWDYIHDPAVVLGIFERDEDAQNQVVVIDKTFLNTDGQSVSFITMSGSVLSILHEKLYNVEFSYGSVTAPNQDPRAGLTYHFSTADGLLYSFVLKNGTNLDKYRFDGITKSYKKVDSGEPYTTTIDFSKVDGVIFPMPCGANYTLYKFNKLDLPQYSSGSGSVMDFSALGAIFQPFLQNLPIEKDGRLVGQAIAGQIYSGCLYCRETATAQMTEKYCQKPELWYIDKAAQLRVIFPEYFKKFTQEDEHWAKPVSQTYTTPGSGMGYGGSSVTIPATSWYWGQYLANNTQLATDFSAGTNLRNYFSTFCYKFRDFIDTAIINSGLFWSNLSESTPVTTIINHLDGEPIFQIGKAPLNKRQLAIKILISGYLPEYKEDAILKILASVEPGDQAAMLSYLASDVKIKTLFDKFHNFGGKPNFTKAITLVSGFIQNPGYDSVAYKLISKVEGAKYVSVDLDLFDNRQTDGYTITEDNKIEFYNKVQLPKDPYDDPRYPAGTADQVFLTVPYDMVIPVDFWTDFELGGKVYRRKEIGHMPAMYAALLLDRAGAELFSKKAWLAFDGVMLFVGVGEVKVLFSTASWIRKAAVVSNLVGSSMGIVTDLAPESVIPPKIKNRIRIASMLLQLPDAIRGIREIANNLGKTADEAKRYADEVGGISDPGRQRLYDFAALVKTESEFGDDAAEFGRRVVTLGQGDVSNAKQWLTAIPSSDNKVYIIAHSDGRNFSVMTRTGDEVVINHRSLAKWIEGKNYPSGQDIVLLSCSDLNTAQNLSNKLNRKIIASEGSVSVHSDGGISSDKPFMELNKNTAPAPYSGSFVTPGTSTTKITLRSGWKGFIDELEDWSSEMRTALDADISASTDMRVLFTNATNRSELAEAWRLLRNPNNLNASNALFKNPSALEALARIRNNSKLSELGLSDEILASIRGYGTGTTAASYAEVINDLDNLGNFLTAYPGTTLENFDQTISMLRSGNDNYKQGIHWMIRDISSDSKTFKGRKLKFEFKVTNEAENAAYVDLYTNHTPPKFIEYKSGPGAIKRATIVDQFVRRDLLNIQQLGQLEWRVTMSNLKKSDLVNAGGTGWLQTAEAIESLNKPGIISKFDSYAESIGYSSQINTVDDLISFLNSNDKWFDLIFKIK